MITKIDKFNLERAISGAHNNLENLNHIVSKYGSDNLAPIESFAEVIELVRAPREFYLARITPPTGFDNDKFYLSSIYPQRVGMIMNYATRYKVNTHKYYEFVGGRVQFKEDAIATITANYTRQLNEAQTEKYKALETACKAINNILPTLDNGVFSNPKIVTTARERYFLEFLELSVNGIFEPNFDRLCQK